MSWLWPGCWPPSSRSCTWGTSWRIGVDPGERTALVTTGVFALARNPIFTAMTVTSLGITLMTPNLISLAATLMLVVSVQLQVRAAVDFRSITTTAAYSV